jgi:hypothetical protein
MQSLVTVEQTPESNTSSKVGATMPTGVSGASGLQS